MALLLAPANSYAAPAISSLAPSSAIAGGSAFTLTVSGSGFGGLLITPIVQWNGSPRPTTQSPPGSSTQLTATITATDIAAAGTAQITVLNDGLIDETSSPVTFTISNPGLTITTGSPLPAAAEGSPYSQTLSAAGGTVPYSWSIDSGSLPGGLALSSTGVISGNPSTSGTFNFTVRISDGSQPTSQTATKVFSLLVSAVAPVVSSIAPSAVLAGSPAFTLIVNGANFVSGSTVRWNGANRTTTFVSNSRLTATIPAADIVTPGTASISVLNPGPTSNALTFTILPPLTITTNSPLPQGTVGTSYSRTLTAAGGTVPYTWSIAAGALPAGLAISSSTGAISGNPSTSGTFNFTVRVSDDSQPTPQAVTKAFTLVVSSTTPVLSSIDPRTVHAGSPAFSLTVSGTNFVSGSTVRWNGANRTTTFVSTSQLTAAIPAGDVASRGTATVSVANPLGTASNALTFTVSPPVLTITTSSLPGGVVGVAYSQTLSAAGGQPPYSWSVVAGSLPAGLALAPSTGILSGTPSATGTSNFTVRVSDDGAQPTPQTMTRIFTLTVTAAAPVLNSLNPSSAVVGGPAFTLTVNGTNFASGSTMRWNGANRTTTFVSGSQLTAAIPAADIVTLGTASITVLNPGPSTSNALTFTIAGPGLTVTTNSPLPQGTVGTSYSQTLAASGGAPPYSWSVTSGSLPNGLTLNASNGTIGGTASGTGSSTFTIQVRDSASSTATKQFQLSIASTASPTFVISGISNSVDPLQQPSIAILLASAYPSPISGQLTLKLTSNADVAGDDPTIQFSTGGRTINFLIPANSTQAVFANNASNIAFQTGTVAGTIDLTLSAQTGGSPQIAFPPTSRSLALTRRAPAVTGVSIASRNASGFELAITGFSTPRSLTQATFLFMATQGANLQTSTVTVSLATAATNWFQSQTATSLGGQFRLLIPFAVQGEITAIQSLSVTLTNGEGTSSASSVQF